MPKKEKQNFVENLTTEAENASKSGNSRMLFNTMKQLCNKATITNVPIKDKSGITLTQGEQQKQRWAEHFRETLNRPPPNHFPIIAEEAQIQTLNASCSDIALNEVKIAIKN